MNKQDQPRPRFLRDIYATQPDEIHCDQAAIEMVRATAAELTAAELQQQYPQLGHHLELCADCAAEYALLRQLTTAEIEEEDVEDIPPVPDRPNLAERLRGAITAVFAGFPTPSPTLATRGATLGLDPVDVDLPEGKLAVTLDVDVSEQDETLRNLFVTIMPRVEMMLDGVTMELRTADEQHVIAEATLDRLGDGAFLQIPPGRYALVWPIGEEWFVIKDVVLP